MSRATVSRLLAEARRQGIVRIQIVPPARRGADRLAGRVAAALGLRAVHVSAPIPAPSPSKTVEDVLGSVLAPALSRALKAIDFVPGDVLLVASGRTMYEVARYDLPRLPGVVVAPTIGGTDQPEGWYQTNEITRRIAEQVGGRATYLFAPALPGPELYATLQHDPAIQQVLQLWPKARCLLTGVGAPPLLRTRAPEFVDPAAAGLVDAIGDVCGRFFSPSGQAVEFPGNERLLAVGLDLLRTIPNVIAIAAGTEKVSSIVAGARAGLFSQLVTDPRTAEELVAAADLGQDRTASSTMGAWSEGSLPLRASRST
jgi:DNA-binding transcriptional regulator LsrR (DeoR family)